MTNEEKLVWAAAFAEAYSRRNPYPALYAAAAVAKLRASTLDEFTAIGSKELEEARAMLAEMQGRKAA